MQYDIAIRYYLTPDYLPCAELTVSSPGGSHPLVPIHSNSILADRDQLTSSLTVGPYLSVAGLESKLQHILDAAQTEIDRRRQQILDLPEDRTVTLS